MSTLSKQKSVASCPYTEALRYISNAKNNLAKAGFEDGRYIDRKYVRTACGVAYSGVLVAVDAWLLTKGVEPSKEERATVKFYTKQLAKLNKKLLDNFTDVYDILHRSGYYDGILNAAVIKEGFKMANEIIETIKPAQQAPKKI